MNGAPQNHRRESITSPAVLYSGIFIAFSLFFIMFGLKIVPFWPAMTLSGFCLCSYACITGGVPWHRGHWTTADILLGLGSAAVLYGIFAVGNYIFREFLHFGGGQIDSVYMLRGGTPPWVLIVTLLLVIGPAEEIFWRGFLQRSFSMKLGPIKGYLAATGLYAAVHIPAMNPVLFLAALLGGGFWGLMYSLAQESCRLHHQPYALGYSDFCTWPL